MPPIKRCIAKENCSYTQERRLYQDICNELETKVSEIFEDFQHRMYIENGELPFDLGIELDKAQTELVNKIIEVLRFQQSEDIKKEVN